MKTTSIVLLILAILQTTAVFAEVDQRAARVCLAEHSEEHSTCSKKYNARHSKCRDGRCRCENNYARLTKCYKKCPEAEELYSSGILAKCPLQSKKYFENKRATRGGRGGSPRLPRGTDTSRRNESSSTDGRGGSRGLPGGTDTPRRKESSTDGRTSASKPEDAPESREESTDDESVKGTSEENLKSGSATLLVSFGWVFIYLI